MIFDSHADIWTDVTMMRQRGFENIFKMKHLHKYRDSGVNGGIFVIWIDPPYDSNPKKRAVEIIENMSAEILDNQDIIKIVRSYKDLTENADENKISVLIGLEGLSFIGERIDLLNSLYMFGARHASLTWNEENALATGVRGNNDRGLTEAGKMAIKRMEKLGIILDVSHLNDKSFWDVACNATRPFIASHSNCRKLCSNMRNLTDDQLRTISDAGGVVGLNAFSDFVDDDKSKRDIYHLANHIDHMTDIMGIDHVGFGFDFCDYLESDTMSSFAEEESANTKGFENITKVPLLIEILKERGYRKEDIDKIAYKNYFKIIKEIIR